MNEKQIIKLIGASIFAVLFLWGVYVFSGYYSQWQEKKAQQEQHAREQMAEQYMSSYTEKLQKTLEKPDWKVWRFRISMTNIRDRRRSMMNMVIIHFRTVLSLHV